ncbi:protein-disulfide reductase DsbD [Arhodomonas sp. SL1]|uniref:protein-disulfide reductase DsbD n=1 Tax=Arhodomonas sp. SL1 TaxID=3425691 RepID=UPI003F8859DE
MPHRTAHRRLFSPPVLALGCLLLLLAAAVGAQGQSGALSGLVGGQEDLLPPEQAFPLTVERVAEDRLVARWDVQEGYYLYRDKIDFRGAGGEVVRRIESPPGEIDEDPYFGEVAVFREPVSMSIYVDEGGPFTLVADYQGCAEAGVCYPPETVEVAVAGVDGAAPAAGASGGGGWVSGGSAALDGALASGRLVPILGGFFVAGLLLAFTACLYPMVPILSGLIAGDRHRTGARAFWLSLVYVEATAVTYAAAGVAAGLTGSAIQADLQGPWVLGGFAALLVVMALAMLGVFQLQLPSAWQTRLAALSHRQHGGTFAGAAVMGMLSALIVGACSGPALIVALAFISTTGDAWLGGLALFVLANGMGVPLLAIGTAAGRWLPRAGPWMTAVRAVVGVLFLGVAIYLLERLLDGAVTLALWGALLLGCGVFLGGLDRLGPGAPPARRLRKAGGMALFIWGAVALVGASAGGGDVWRPLSSLTVAGGPAPEPTGVVGEFREVDDLSGLREALAGAQASGRPALVDVYADWCVYCVKLDEETFADATVRERLAGAELLRVDVTEMSAADKRLLQAYDVFLPPAVMLFDADGEERREHRVVGFLGPEAFIGRLERAWGTGAAG